MLYSLGFVNRLYALSAPRATRCCRPPTYVNRSSTTDRANRRDQGDKLDRQRKGHPCPESDVMRLYCRRRIYADYRTSDSSLTFASLSLFRLLFLPPWFGHRQMLSSFIYISSLRWLNVMPCPRNPFFCVLLLLRFLCTLPSLDVTVREA